MSTIEFLFYDAVSAEVVIDEPIDPAVFHDPRLRVRSSVPCDVAVFLGTAAHDADWLREHVERPQRSA